jgi:microcystin-dependent protein
MPPTIRTDRPPTARGPRAIDRRRFLGLCAIAATVAACGSSDDDDAGASAGTLEATSAGTDAASGPALRVGNVEAPSVGQLIHVAFGYAPGGALVCDGTTASVADWPDLAALLGTTFGGDGTATFGLPELSAGEGLRWLIVAEGGPFANGQPAFLGEVRPMVVEPPTGSSLDTTWLPCDGRRLPIRQNEALYALMGTTFGGDGRVDFALPALPPLGGLRWRIARDGHFPGTTCDAVTPAFSKTVPLAAYLGSITHLAYTDDNVTHACGVALCRGQQVPVGQHTELYSLLGTTFGGDPRGDTFGLPTLPVVGAVTPTIVVNGTYPDRY